MRACLCLIPLLACHPSATVQNTSPIANLQSYRTLALRVRSAQFAMYAPSLDSNLAQKLRAACGFEHIVRPGKGPSDVLVLDVNITAMGRGGSGMIRNSAMATVDTLVVLTDGQSRELLGTSRIHGESSGMIVNNVRPESEAIDVVAKAVVETLAKSGCTGPRVARVEPPPAPQGGSGVLTSNEGSDTTAPPPPGVDESKRPEAEKLNDQGKDQLQNADMQGALASFQQAVALIPDARYEFNICLTFEAQEQWASAVGACKQARTMNPEPRLVEKIDHRLDLISHRK